MDFRWTLVLPVALAVAGCDYQRKVSGTFKIGGQTFAYERTNTETAGGIDVESDDFRYNLTFPDGTTETTYAYEDDYRARRHRDKLAREWLEKKKKEPGISDTIAGPPEDPANLPEAEDSKGD